MWGARVALINGFPRSTLHPKEGEVALSTREALKGNLTLTQPLSESRLLSCAEWWVQRCCQVHSAALLQDKGTRVRPSQLPLRLGPCSWPYAGQWPPLPSVTKVRFCDFTSQTSRVLPGRQTPQHRRQPLSQAHLRSSNSGIDLE